jgi:hypothetical protein
MKVGNFLESEGAYKTHESTEELSKKNFWSSDYQKEMSARSVKSEYAMKMRSVGGKEEVKIGTKMLLLLLLISIFSLIIKLKQFV